AEFFVQYRDEATQLEDIASFNAFTATVRADDRVERLRVSAPSLSLFSTVGVEPIAGRLPRPEELGQTAVISIKNFSSSPKVPIFLNSLPS
ncbi:MAG: hypothetical protein F6K22_33705, partial [Okeania sp. SIO2F4]|uniref:hypothetical protein n=1 Tax=Okeania sp. SIO2F4 TaxID=2607790 RepID=UPI00142AFF51